jgi:putative sterol carrier protein
MAKYLTPEWMDEFVKLAAGQPERPGLDVKIQYVTTDAPGGDTVNYYWIVEAGRITESVVGEIDDPDFTMTVSYDDAAAIQQGELEANAAFMQGKMKISGNVPRMMSLLPLTTSPEWKALQESLKAVTEY